MTTNRNDSKLLRHSALAMAVVTGLLVQGQAHAQEANRAPTTDKPKVTTLGTITVTAQGRKEDILAVPYNISVVSGSTIEQAHILDSTELLRYVPGVGVLDRGARGSNIVSGIRIRGLAVDSSALGDYGVGAAATVATYVNSTPLFANFLLSDIERVEVLRGPQGTLYGSGALGGAVRFLLRQPDLDVASGQVSLSLSSANHSDSIGNSESFTYNLPVSDTFAIRVNGTRNDLPGTTDYKNLYVLDANGIPVAPAGVLAQTASYTSKKDADFVKQNYGRVSLYWKPSDTMNFTLSYMTQADRFGGRRGTSIGNDGYGVPYKDFEIGSIQLEPSARHVNLTSLEANFDLGFATLTSSTASYNHEGDIVSENTGRYASAGWLKNYYYNYPRPMAKAARSYSEKAVTQEFRLVSNAGDTFDYILGAFFQDEKRLTAQDSFLVGMKQWSNAYFAPGHNPIIDDQDWLYRQHEHFKETALYGELTWHATDTLQFTGGFRYFSDDTEVNEHQVTGNNVYFRVASDSNGKQSDSSTLFKGNMSWTFAPNQQLYATISEGYRRGGTNGTPTTGFFKENVAWTSYKADTVTNYEFGVKGGRGRLTYNANVFYLDWKDPQINTVTTNWGFFAVQNVDKASSRGVELELSNSFENGFAYGLGYTYTDAHLDANAIAADGAYVINYKGARLPGSPTSRFNAWASYGMTLGSGLLTFRGDAYHQSETQNILNKSSSSQYAVLPGFGIVNLSATYTQNNWDVSVWIKNVGNSAGVTGVYTRAYMGPDPTQHYFGNGSKYNVAAPRTVGVTVSYSF